MSWSADPRYAGKLVDIDNLRKLIFVEASSNSMLSWILWLVFLIGFGYFSSDDDRFRDLPLIVWYIRKSKFRKKTCSISPSFSHSLSLPLCISVSRSFPSRSSRQRKKKPAQTNRQQLLKYMESTRKTSRQTLGTNRHTKHEQKNIPLPVSSY